MQRLEETNNEADMPDTVVKKKNGLMEVSLVLTSHKVISQTGQRADKTTLTVSVHLSTT